MSEPRSGQPSSPLNHLISPLIVVRPTSSWSASDNNNRSNCRAKKERPIRESVKQICFVLTRLLCSSRPTNWQKTMISAVVFRDHRHRFPVPETISWRKPLTGYNDLPSLTRPLGQLSRRSASAELLPTDLPSTQARKAKLLRLLGAKNKTKDSQVTTCSPLLHKQMEEEEDGVLASTQGNLKYLSRSLSSSTPTIIFIA